MYVQAKLPFSFQRISNMYLYSDIVELSLVGHSQVPIMGFLPIKSNFQEIGHGVFTPSLYVRVREKNIRTITIKISTETGEEFPIHDDVVTCRLNFRRRPFLVKAYIKNYELKFNPLTFWKNVSTNLIEQCSFYPKRQWFRFSGDQGNIQVPIWPGFRRCASRHSAIYPKGGAISQINGNERRLNSFKSLQRIYWRGCHNQRRNQFYAQTYDRCGLRLHGRAGRLQAN